MFSRVTLSPTLPPSTILFCGTPYAYASRHTLPHSSTFHHTILRNAVCIRIAPHSPSLSPTIPRLPALKIHLFLTPAKPPHMAVTAARSLPPQSGPPYELLPPPTLKNSTVQSSLSIRQVKNSSTKVHLHHGPLQQVRPVLPSERHRNTICCGALRSRP